VFLSLFLFVASKFYDLKPQRAQISGFLWARRMFGIAKEEFGQGECLELQKKKSKTK